VDFALRWPNHLLVMFDLPVKECKGAKKDHALGENAFKVLLDCIAATQESGDLPAGDPLPLAWTAWSLVHGIARLAISGNLPLNADGIIAFTRNAAQAIFGGASLQNLAATT
jgi:hypothetical protein